MWTSQEQQQASYLARLAHPQQQQQNVHHAGVIDAEMVMDSCLQQQQQQQQIIHQLHRSLPSHHQQQQHLGLSSMELSSTSNSRASRNKAEKQRRDNLNTNISSMAALVPTIAGSSRRMDKISILRLAAAFLRTQYTLGRGSTDFLPRQFNDFDLEQYFVDNLIGSAGFFIVLTSSGKIVYVSRQVERQLGHTQNELLGLSLYDFIDPNDCGELARNLTPDEMQQQSIVSSSTNNNGSSNIGQQQQQIHDATADNNSSSSEDSTSYHQNRNNTERKPFKEQRRNFKLRMSQRTVSRRESIQYECLQFTGVLRLAEACKNNNNNNNNEANANRTRNRETASTSNDIVFVGMARLPKKRSITELSIIDANKEEYVTRHLVDGRIIYCDHRVSVVAGYLSEEVSGLSAFSFMHKDDFRWTMIGLRQMYDRAETCGSSCYRLLAKTGEFIYLRTHGYLEYDKGTQTVESFVCINTLVSEEEGMELIREMKERFSATVSGTTKAMIKNSDDRSFDLGSDSQKSNSSTHLEDPSQLEDAITHLVSDLPSPAVSEDRLSPSPMPNTQFAKAAIFSQRLPPAATQASKIGIKKIDHYLVLQGKGNRTTKRDGKTEENSNQQENQRNDWDSVSPNATVVEQQQQQQRSVKNNSTNDLKSNQQHTFVANDNTITTLTPTSITPCLDAILNTTVLNTNSIGQVLQGDNSNCENNVTNNMTETKLCQLEKQNPTLEYLKDGIDESQLTDSALNRRYSSKRIYNEESRTNSSRKKRNKVQIDSTAINVNVNVNAQRQRDISYTNCKNVIKDEPLFPTLPDLNSFEQISSTNSMKIRTSDSPNSSLQDINVEYQQLDPSTPLVISNVDDEQFVDLQDLKEDSQLSPGLDSNPDIMLKIFDDLRPVMGFEKNLNELEVQTISVHNQVMSNEIQRTHLQLANTMAITESQFDVLARNIENPALQVQRKNLTQLQAEHNMQKQVFKTLQQDHHNIQVNMKHNIGV